MTFTYYMDDIHLDLQNAQATWIVGVNDILILVSCKGYEKFIFYHAFNTLIYYKDKNSFVGRWTH
jgi:hypothetical protein